MMRRAAAGLALLLAAAGGCAAPAEPAGFDREAFAVLWERAEQGAVDYQLGGAYDPAPGVTVVVRDRSEVPAGVVLDVCYVNAFQTQPDELDWWLAEHPDLPLRDAAGEPIVDPGWPDERLRDTRAPAQLRRSRPSAARGSTRARRRGSRRSSSTTSTRGRDRMCSTWRARSSWRGCSWSAGTQSG